MYYDRSLPTEALRLLAPGGGLAGLVAWLRDEPSVRVGFRRDDSDERRRGAIGIYVGRTCLVELQFRAGGAVVATAHPRYRSYSPSLFRSHRARELDELEGAVRRHLERTIPEIHPKFRGGEGAVHTALMRRYSLSFGAGDLFVAVDCEAKLGFRGEDGRAPGEVRGGYEEAAGRALGWSDPLSARKKLDAVGILADGSIALVEVKKRRGSIAEAARQAATHAFHLGRFMQTPGCHLATMLNGMVAQKTHIGLLAPGAYRASSWPALVPVVAAPDDREDWVRRWTDAIARSRTASPPLAGLRFWRLSDEGEIVEEHQP
jgi:hypothetical protein